MTRSPPILERAGASERIRRAGITLFKARGYHVTSVRALAQVVGIEAASLYHHFPSKQEILCDIFDRAMDDLLEGLRRALSGATSLEDRLRAAVRFHVLFHIERQDEAQRAIRACKASRPSVSAAGPGCRMIGDLTSCTWPSRTAAVPPVILAFHATPPSDVVCRSVVSNKRG